MSDPRFPIALDKSSQTMATKHDGPDMESIRIEIARIAPRFEGAPIARLGEGMDSLAVLVGDAIAFRFAKHAEAAGLRREITLLPRLAPRLHLDIPRSEYIGEYSGTGLPCVGYCLIRGEPLPRPLYDGLPGVTRDGILGGLAAFLSAVHAFPVREAAECGVAPHADRAGYLEDLRRARDEVFPLLDDAVRHVVESRLDAFLEHDTNFAYAPTLLHADLWPEHVLFLRAAGRLAGVIDFGDVSIGDPTTT
jgi:aminoglycoside 2''-phosphotransferase